MLQTTRSFPEYGTRAKVTSAYFYSPSKRNFERTSEPGRDYGILPDLFVEVDRGHAAPCDRGSNALRSPRERPGGPRGLAGG